MAMASSIWGSFGAKTDFGAGLFPLGTGTGSFGPKTDFGTGVRPDTVAVGDFNGDGKLDLVTANNFDGTVSILLGTGTGS